MPPLHRAAAPLLLAVTVALTIGGCLPSAVKPTMPLVPPSPTVAPTPGPPTPTPEPTPVPSPTFMVYTVMAGDSLLGLAERFHTTGRSIAYWSRDLHPSLDPASADYDPNRLEAGWVVRIIPGTEYTVPIGPGDSPDPTPTPTPEPSASPEPSGSDAASASPGA
jgi:type VI secretion system secreted protein VgrG